VTGDTHPDTHEEALLAYALGDPDAGSEPDTIAQLQACAQCVTYGYQLLADLPDIARAPVDTSRLEAALGAALEALGQADAPDAAIAEVVPLRSRRWARTWVPLALAAALAFGIWYGRRGPAPAPDEEEAWVAEARPLSPEPVLLLEETRAGLKPDGLSFTGESTQWTFLAGYTLGVLSDLALSDGAADRDEAALRGVLAERGLPVEVGTDPAMACDGLGDDYRNPCRMGVLAYRLCRDMREDGATAQVLRSPAARRLLTNLDALVGPQMRPIAVGLSNKVRADQPPDATEAEVWTALVRSLLR